MMEVNDFAEPPPSKGSGCSKTVIWVLAIVGGGGLLLVIVCCGVFFWFVKDAFSDDPARVREMTESITDIEIPDRYPPSFYMKIPIFNVTVVSYDREIGSDGASLRIWAFPPNMTGNEQQMQQMRDQMDQSLRQQGLQQPHITVADAPENRTFTIRGEEQTVEIARGTTDNDTAMVRVEAQFTAKDGSTATFTLLVPEDQWDEAELKAILDSTNPAGP